MKITDQIGCEGKDSGEVITGFEFEIELTSEKEFLMMNDVAIDCIIDNVTIDTTLGGNTYIKSILLKTPNNSFEAICFDTAENEVRRVTFPPYSIARFTESGWLWGCEL